MIGRNTRAKLPVLASLVISVLMMITAMPVFASGDKEDKAGTAVSGLRAFAEAYIPGVRFGKTTTKDGRFIMKGQGLKSFPGTKKARFAVWHNKDKSDLKEYDAGMRKDGTCKAEFPVSDHGFAFGEYQLQLILNIKGKDQVIATRAASLTGDNYAFVVPADQYASVVLLSVANPHIDEAAATEVHAVVQSKEGGKEDREKYTLKEGDDQVWQATVGAAGFAIDGGFDATLYAGSVGLGSLEFYMKRRAPEKGGRAVALTFDDGPAKGTEKILKQLKKYDAHATFFVVGKNAKRYGDTLKAITDQGSEIGNHSYDHAKLGNAEEDKIRKELDDTNKIVQKYTGTPTTIVRPPYGNIGPNLREYVQAPMILWSIDTLDWKTHDVQATIDTTLDKVKDGDIILMHDIHDESVEAAVKLIPLLKKEGYELVTVSELAAARGKKLKSGEAYRNMR